MSTDEETKEREDQDRKHRITVTALMLGLTLAVAGIWAGSYYLKTPRAPAAPKPLCEAVIIDIGTSALIGVPIYAPETAAGTPLMAVLRCKDVPPDQPVTAKLTTATGENLNIDATMELGANGWVWAVVDLTSPPVGEYELHFTAQGRELAGTWFRVVETPTP